MLVLLCAAFLMALSVTLMVQRGAGAGLGSSTVGEGIGGVDSTGTHLLMPGEEEGRVTVASNVIRQRAQHMLGADDSTGVVSSNINGVGEGDAAEMGLLSDDPNLLAYGNDDTHAVDPLVLGTAEDTHEEGQGTGNGAQNGVRVVKLDEDRPVLVSEEEVNAAVEAALQQNAAAAGQNDQLEGVQNTPSPPPPPTQTHTPSPALRAHGRPV